MSKISLLLAHPIFKSACALAIGALMLLESHSLYAGFAFGIGVKEFLLAFKK